MWFHSDAHRKIVESLKNKNADIAVRTLQCCGETISILYIKQLTDRASLSDNVIKPLAQYCQNVKKPAKAEQAMESILYADDCSIAEDENLIEQYILDGLSVLVFSNDRQYLVVNSKKVAHRPVSEPELQYNIRSPRDCFVENLDINLSLLRYRMKDTNLKIENFVAGRRTKSRIVMVYISDIANDTCVKEIRKRINSIDTDGIMSTGEVQSFLLNSQSNIFPEMIVVERSDWTSELLLEGKVVLLMDGSTLALAAPVAFTEFMYACDDRYDNHFLGFFMRLLRYSAFFLSFSASSYWIAMVSFHSDVLPAGFIIALAEARSKVPFSALLGTVLLEFIVELIRESLLRVPNKIGPAIAIVSAIIIGQAAISAGVFSALLLILISVEFLASFAIPSQIASNPLRIIKFLLLGVTSIFGFYGLILGITVIVGKMASINSFGVPYLAPYGPFNLHDFLRAFMFDKTFSKKRQQYMRDKDDTRSGG